MNHEDEAEKLRIDAYDEIISDLRRYAPKSDDSDPRGGNLDLSCSGLCSKVWHFAYDLYCCKFCPETIFCRECLAKPKQDELPIFVCNSNHEWLHVLLWSDEEYTRVGGGNVLIGGEIKDGLRDGGTVVGVKEWLNILRDLWGVPRIVEKNVNEPSTDAA